MNVDLERTIHAAGADLVLLGTPVDVARFLSLNKPARRIRYERQEVGRPTLEE